MWYLSYTTWLLKQQNHKDILKVDPIHCRIGRLDFNVLIVYLCIKISLLAFRKSKRKSAEQARVYIFCIYK